MVNSLFLPSAFQRLIQTILNIPTDVKLAAASYKVIINVFFIPRIKTKRKVSCITFATECKRTGQKI